MPFQHRRWIGYVLLFALGCGEQTPPSVRTAREFANAIARNHVEAVIPMLQTQVAQRLTQAATRASDQVGGRRALDASEMLQIVGVPSYFQIAAAHLVSGDDHHATVELTGADDTRYTLNLVYEDPSWRVVIPVPPQP